MFHAYSLRVASAFKIKTLINDQRFSRSWLEIGSVVVTSKISTIDRQMLPQSNNKTWRASLMTAFCDNSHASPFVFHHNPPPIAPLMQRVVEAFSIFTSIQFTFSSLVFKRILWFLPFYSTSRFNMCHTTPLLHIFNTFAKLFFLSFFSMWIFPSRPLQSKARVTNSSWFVAIGEKFFFNKFST